MDPPRIEMLQTAIPLRSAHRTIVLREWIQPIHVRVSRQRLIIADLYGR